MTYKQGFFRSIYLFCFVFFTVSHMLCWLNPSEDRPNVFFQIPYGWEYNTDSGLELSSTIDFPDGMFHEKVRVARPLKNALIGGLINFIDKCSSTPLTDRVKLGVSYLFHHSMNFVVGIMVIAIIFALGKKFSIAPFILMFGSMYYVIANIVVWSHSHTAVFQVASSAFILFFCFSLLIGEMNCSLPKRIVYHAGYAFLAGFFVLIKQDYAIFLALVVFFLVQKKYMETMIWSIFFNVPLLLYRGIIFFSGHEWYSHELEACGQGVWFFSYPLKHGILSFMQKLIVLVDESLMAFVTYYGIILLVLAIYGALYAENENGLVKHELRRRILLFAICLFFGTFVQAIAANRPTPYMFGNMMVPLIIIAGFGYRILVNLLPKRERQIQYALYGYLFYSFTITLVNIVHLPWVHPSEQLLRPVETSGSQISRYLVE